MSQLGNGMPATVARRPPANRWKPKGTYQKALAVAIALLAVALGLVLAVGAMDGTTKAPKTMIASGGYLKPGQTISSPNGLVTLVMQKDGNLVEYSDHGKGARWESGTSGNFDAYVVMQADGNLVVYPQGESAPAPGKPTTALWQSSTYGHPGSVAVLLNEGGFEVRSPVSGKILWQP